MPSHLARFAFISFDMPQSRPIERKLTTILAADAANYSGRMSHDEEGTVRALRAARDVIDTAITNAGGRIANTSGDGLIAEFPSVVGAVRCAILIQTTLNQADHMLPFRLGVHLDDVIVEGQDLLGDGVNLAARLQEMADIGGVLISQHVHDHVRGKLSGVKLRPLGPATPKHLRDEIGLYAVVADGVNAPRLPDNLGPKVGPLTEMPEPAQPTPTTEMRAKFVKDRMRIGGAILALAVVDIAAGLPFFVTTIPTLILIYILYKRWRALRAVEKATV
ncbi:adenylate/guanylate cyclase domain-containing protein [uncultured Tateyamaria sp.]|uniref:adenylate/guanylate cyclase domain-containing protein n=1 Tax=uncultured Tateyamaria sp. TaxID=455651 RepID=UPI0026171938|nr:adenylate/guanylate cyclase domain-containing protein [uncultured Tateyamaria sp.]